MSDDIQIDGVSGVVYVFYGLVDGELLMLMMLLMVLYEVIFGFVMMLMCDGYLFCLVDCYCVVLVDYFSIGVSCDILLLQLMLECVCVDLLVMVSVVGFDCFIYWGYFWGGGVGLQLVMWIDWLKVLVVGGWLLFGGFYWVIVDVVELKQYDLKFLLMVVLCSKVQYM